MSDRFLDFLKKSNANRYKALIKEIEQCKKDLNYVEEFNDDDDEILCDALDNSKNEPVKRKQNDSSNIPSKRRKEDSEENTTTNRSKYICKCGKSYNHRQSLHRHKKKCQEKSEQTENEIQQTIQERNVSMSSPAIEKLVPPTASSTSVGTLVPPTASFDLDVCMEDAIEESRQPEPTPFQNSSETITSDRRMQQPVCINGGFTCRHCEISFDSFSALVDHIEVNHPMSQSGHGNAPSSINMIGSNDQNSTDLGDVVSAIDDQVEIVTINPSSEDERYDLLNFFAKSRENIKDILQARREQLGNMKVYLNSRVEMTRDLDEGDKTTVPHFRSKTFTLFESDEPEDDLNSAFQEMADSMENFINEGSDWRMEEVVCMEVVTVPFEPLNGSSYLPLPPGYDKIRSVVNIKNRDNRCFLWSVLAALHPQPIHPERVAHYYDFENELNMGGIQYPVPINKIPVFERQNKISVNVFGIDKSKIFPMYLSSLDDSQTDVDLLYLKDGEQSHYCLIKDLNKFLGLIKKAKIKHHFCRRCLHGFVRQDLLAEHVPYCKRFDFQHVKYPKEGKEDVLEFKSVHKMLKAPFVIYADFETLVENRETNPSLSDSKHDGHFKPCGYAYKVVCCNDKFSRDPVVYRGENAVEHFLDQMIIEENEIHNILANSEPLLMNEETERKFQDATSCEICKQSFDSKRIKVRDHHHIGVAGDRNDPNYSNYRSTLCQECNLALKENKYVPVFFHNLKGFDGHLLCQAIGKFNERDIKCIAQNMNRYVSISLGNLRFLDSFQFMSTSLEQLVDNLKKEGIHNFKHFLKEFEDPEIASMLLRKNVYCYDYIDSFQKFNESNLPPKERFYNTLKQEHISDTDYEHVKEVWRTLELKTLGDLHDNYVLTDVLLLADVFEKFREMTMGYYGLDAAHYFTAPGLAWDAALKMTDVRLDLLTDPLMYNFFEIGLRGGVSMVSKRLSKANNKHLKNFNEKELTKYIMYYDFNNLYGGVMSKFPLPMGMFRWLSKDEISSFDINSISNDSKLGYTLEVDLEYPDELHDSHNGFPLAPQHKAVSDEELSSYSRKLWEDLNKKEGVRRNRKQKRPKAKKLIPSLENKENYVIHYRTLQLYLDLGLKCTKIHRVLEYRQEPWLQKYIDFNSEKRKHAKSDFEKDFFKLMNNSVFGKTMENLRGRVDIRLVTKKQKLKKVCAKPSFKRIEIFNSDLVGVENIKQVLLLNKPVYVGQTILDLSKFIVYNFHYNVMKEQYKENATLLYTDTDSLIYEIHTEDVYRDMQMKADLYDLSNFERDHFLFDETNKKVVLKMKDECGGVPISEFCGLRAKMYSILQEDGVEKRTAKGVSKSVINKDFHHGLYKKCLLEKTATTNEMCLITNNKHLLYRENTKKRGLSAYDDKRWLKNDGIESYAYGHHAIQDELNLNILTSLESFE